MGQPLDWVYSSCFSPPRDIGVDLLEGCGVVVRFVQVGCECVLTLLYSNMGAKCG